MIHILDVKQGRRSIASRTWAIQVMKVFAVSNQKGGVGKTTSAYNLAFSIAEKGNPVCMIDLDPQASLTKYCGMGSGDFREHDIITFITPQMRNKRKTVFGCVHKVERSGLENLYLVPSCTELANKSLELQTRATYGQFALKHAVQELDGVIDYIFIDCPPQLGFLLVNALVAATDVIIPVKTEKLSHEGLISLMETITGVRGPDDELAGMFNHDLKVAGIIGTMYEKNVKDHNFVLDELRQEAEILDRGSRLLGVIKKAAVVNKGFEEGIPVVKFDPGCEPSWEYRRIADLLQSERR